MTIRDAIQALAGRGTATLQVCRVDAVDRQARTIDCTPIDDSAPILGCALQSNLDGQEGLCVIPRVGSYVLVGMLSGGNVGMLLLTDMIDEVLITIAHKTISMTMDGIVINGGELGGLVNVEPLVARLNKIEQELSNLKQTLVGWVPVPQDGGASLKGAVSSWASSPVQQTSRLDLEDTTIKH